MPPSELLWAHWAHTLHRAKTKVLLPRLKAEGFDSDPLAPGCNFRHLRPAIPKQISDFKGLLSAGLKLGLKLVQLCVPLHRLFLTALKLGLELLQLLCLPLLGGLGNKQTTNLFTYVFSSSKCQEKVAAHPTPPHPHLMNLGSSSLDPPPPPRNKHYGMDPPPSLIRLRPLISGAQSALSLSLSLSPSLLCTEQRTKKTGTWDAETPAGLQELQSLFYQRVGHLLNSKPQGNLNEPLAIWVQIEAARPPKLTNAFRHRRLVVITLNGCQLAELLDEPGEAGGGTFW